MTEEVKQYRAAQAKKIANARYFKVGSVYYINELADSSDSYRHVILKEGFIITLPGTDNRKPLRYTITIVDEDHAAYLSYEDYDDVIELSGMEIKEIVDKIKNIDFAV